MGHQIDAKAYPHTEVNIFNKIHPVTKYFLNAHTCQHDCMHLKESKPSLNVLVEVSL